MTMAFSTQRPPKGRLAFPGPFGCGRPQGSWVPRQNQLVLCGQKGRWRKYCDHVPFTNSQDIDRGNAPDAREQWESLSL